MEKRNISKIVAKAKPKLQKASEEAKSKDDPQAQVAISSLQRNMAKALREHYKMQGISPEELEKDAEQSLAA
ncbi:MAG: hypothetical protein LBH96_04120 [Candidatus Peribacteria bacterium]|jgi:hypothetical protein|nr:hypothetical protein [Candidatus Peribacteria bacterium]